MNVTSQKWRNVLLISGFLLLTILIYWPGLHGGYLFDDTIYYVDNAAVHVTTLKLGDWARAAFGQCNINPSCRPLSSLTFAANYYFSGLNPFWLKLTNLALHIVNGSLVFILLRRVVSLAFYCKPSTALFSSTACAIIAGVWVVNPIHITSVLYISQRMQELSTLFVLAGLISYLYWRKKAYLTARGGVLMAISVVVATLLGLSAKEDAALLPLYTLCLEFTITNFRNADGKISRPAVTIHVLLLLIPALLGTVWITARFSGGVEDFREFTIFQRLLSEPRIISDYIGWTLLPRLNELTFYHDDIAVSQTLTAPITTLFAILFLACLFGCALAARNRLPLFSLGICWFFAGHAMTGTFIPLELAFEHRNYFPAIGLLTAVAALIIRLLTPSRALLKPAIASIAIAYFSFITTLRAEEWAHPIRLAYSEALKRPASRRAQYELATTLIRAAGDDPGSPMLQTALNFLKKNIETNGVVSLQALIYLSARAGDRIDSNWWKAIAEKIQDHPPTQTEIAAVIFLYRCQLDGPCPEQTQELLELFTVALARSDGNPNLVSAYAEFALKRLRDPELARRMARAVVAARPHEPIYLENLIRMLLATGETEEAEADIARLAEMNHLHALDADISALRTLIDEANRESGSSAPTP